MGVCRLLFQYNTSKEAVSAAFPQTELQRCIVHQVRNTLKYVGEKNKKEFANDLKTIYHAPSEDAALEALDRVTEKWEDDYPNAMKSWYKNWDVISPIFKFSADVRKVIYTTNAIESLNSGYRRLNKQRSVFPSDTALQKALYLATHEIAIQKTRRPKDHIWYCGNDIAVDIVGANDAGIFPVLYDDRSVPSKIHEKNDAQTMNVPYLHLDNWNSLIDILKNSPL